MSDVKIQDALRGGIQLLTDSGVPTAANDARLLAAYLLDCSPLDILLLHDLAPQQFLSDFALLSRYNTSLGWLRFDTWS